MIPTLAGSPIEYIATQAANHFTHTVGIASSELPTPVEGSVHRIFKAHHLNTGVIYLGFKDDVVTTKGDGRQGLPLSAREGVSVDATDENIKIYAISDTADQYITECASK